MFDDGKLVQNVQSPETARLFQEMMTYDGDWRERALLTRFRLLLDMPNALHAGEIEIVRGVEARQCLEWWAGGVGGVMVGEFEL
jgi:hypothetical protein